MIFTTIRCCDFTQSSSLPGKFSLLPEVVCYSLDSLVKQHDNAGLVADIRQEMADALTDMRKTRVCIVNSIFAWTRNASPSFEFL